MTSLINDESVACERCGLVMKLEEGRVAVQESMWHLVMKRIQVNKELNARRAKSRNRRDSHQLYKDLATPQLEKLDRAAIAEAAVGLHVHYD